MMVVGHESMDPRCVSNPREPLMGILDYFGWYGRQISTDAAGERVPRIDHNRIDVFL